MIFIYIILIIICLYLLLWFIGKKYNNPYKLIMIFGKKGSGKTTYFTKMAIKYLSKGYIVYSNCNIWGTRVFDVSDFGHYGFPENSVVFIDEVKTIWDSRDFKNFDKLVRDQFIYQRHDKLIIYLASQQFNVDKTIRDLCDELFLLVNYFNIFSVAKKINKKITIHKNEDDGKESFLTEDYSFGSILDWTFTFIPRYIYYFDSFETIEKPAINYFENRKIDPFLEYITNGKNYLRFLIAKAYHRFSKKTLIPEIIREIIDLKKEFKPIKFNISRSYWRLIIINNA